MSDNCKNIRQNLFLLSQDPELIESFDRALDSGILKTDYCPVQDTSGNGLVRDGKYRLNGEVVRIKDWEFGAGNMLDRYYRVHYIDSNLDDQRLVIDAKYPNGVFGGAKYPSKFAPLN